ncbi:MAG TPA: EamA family transporter [Solirubrobacterales bacterium]|nr:EamA family transporter [Solirubrobacterales bacterium]
MARWLIPSLCYVVTVGALGVTSKLALRSVSWQALVTVTTGVYLLAVIVFAALGQIRFGTGIDLFWTVVSAALAVTSLIALYLALGSGEASKVVPISAAYPALTLVLAALFLAEAFTVARAGGVLMVIAGVVVLTTVK